MQVFATLFNTNFYAKCLKSSKTSVEGEESIFFSFQNIYFILAFYQKYYVLYKK
jgi:hypothetical protein